MDGNRQQQTASNQEVLAGLSVGDLLERLSSSDPVPGGGSAAALAGAMGASLVGMVAELTVGRADYAEADGLSREIRDAAAPLRVELLDLAERDSVAYDAFVRARRLPRDTDEQRARRREAMDAAIVQSAQVPLRSARAAVTVLELARRIAPIGNRNAVSDAGVAALLASAAVRGAILNVRINLPLLPHDHDLRESGPDELVRLEAAAASQERAALADVAARLG